MWQGKKDPHTWSPPPLLFLSPHASHPIYYHFPTFYSLSGCRNYFQRSLIASMYAMWGQQRVEDVKFTLVWTCSGNHAGRGRSGREEGAIVTSWPLQPRSRYRLGNHSHRKGHSKQNNIKIPCANLLQTISDPLLEHTLHSIRSPGLKHWRLDLDFDVVLQYLTSCQKNSLFLTTCTTIRLHAKST